MPKGRVESFSDCVIAFAISLSRLICTVAWISHHGFMHDLKYVDPGLLWLNSLYLMRIAFLPFPTGLLGIIRTNLWQSPFTGPSAPRTSSPTQGVCQSWVVPPGVEAQIVRTISELSILKNTHCQFATTAKSPILPNQVAS
jgi:hypothetical protein